MRCLTRCSIAFALLSSLLACAGAEPVARTPEAPQASGAGAGLTVVPVRLLAPAGPVVPSGDDDLASRVDFKTLEVLPDGMIARDGKATGCKVAVDHVVDANGETVVTVASDGTLSFRHALIDPLQARFTPEGIAYEAGATISIGDDGAVALKTPEGKTIPFAARFAPLPPNGRRTAALLVAIHGTFRDAFGGSSLAESPARN